MNVKKHTSENNKVIQLYKNKWNRKWFIPLGMLIFILMVILGIKYHVYHNYRTLASSGNEDTQSSGYIPLGDRLLKYGMMELIFCLSLTKFSGIILLR